MSFFYTERIMAVTDGRLEERDGSLVLDEAAYLHEVDPLPIGPLVDSEAVHDPQTELGAEHGPLHVESGLAVTDFMVFLGRHAIGSSPPEPPMPYLVTEAEADGEGTGILVAVDRANTDPSLWIADHTIQLAQQLDTRTIRSFKGTFSPKLIRFFLAHRA